MADYEYGDHVRLFGGPPDRDEEMRDVRDDADRKKQEAKDEPDDES